MGCWGCWLHGMMVDCHNGCQAETGSDYLADRHDSERLRGSGNRRTDRQTDGWTFVMLELLS